MQRYFAVQKEDNFFILEQSDLHHIKNVMRMRSGDEIEVVFDNQPYLCQVKNIESELKISLLKKLSKKSLQLPRINLIIPLLKEQKMDLIFQKATELGVYEITPLNMTHSIIKLDNKKESKKIERWSRICKEASEQSFRDEVPIVNEVKNIKDLTLADVNIICSTNEKERNLRNVLNHVKECDTINVVIGPEGGISTDEETKLIDMGFLPVTLGNRIMRVETVPLFILSIINYEFMR